jgi:hypothetical protein
MNDTTHDNHDEHDLLEIEALLRSLTPDDLIAEPRPPTRVWASITAELASDDVAPAATSATSVVSLAEHRSRRAGMTRWLGAAAAAVVIVVGAAVVVSRGGEDAQVVAGARLAWEDGFDELGADASARAELVERGGGYEIVLSDTALPAGIEADEDFELWLIEARADGTLDVKPVQKLEGSAAGTYRVPVGLDPTTHTIVDISIEPRDGDEAHSGRSILRGELTA